MSRPSIRSTATYLHHIKPSSFSPRARLPYVSCRNLASAHDSREHVVVLGSGWAGFVFAKQLDRKKYKVTVISPRTYFVFTPLLTDTAVGTLEFRNVLESIRRLTNVNYIQAWADDVDFSRRVVNVEPAVLDSSQSFALTQARLQNSDAVPIVPVSYDKLVVTVGSYNQTFNTPGVRENAYFLKDVGDARRIRKRVLELFELCAMPFVTDEQRRQHLHFVIVGAGPTGMEFAGNLWDLIHQDLARMFKDLMPFVKITMYDVAPKILPMFDAALAEYAEKQYKKHDIVIKTNHHVEYLKRGTGSEQQMYRIKTKEDGEVACGMTIWSTGLMMNPFVEKALNNVRAFPETAEVVQGSSASTDARDRQWVIQRNSRTGSMIVDDHFRVQLHTDERDGKVLGRAKMQDVFALGDCTHIDGVDPPLPATAQVANQEAQFLASMFNKNYSPGQRRLDTAKALQTKGFSFHSRGVMTFLGGGKAVLQAPPTSREGAARGVKGWLAYLIWRGAYLTMTLSWRNKFLIPIQWITVKVFGRSISRF